MLTKITKLILVTSSLTNKLKIINNHPVAIKTSVGVSAKFSLTFTNEANPFMHISVITTGCVPVTKYNQNSPYRHLCNTHTVYSLLSLNKILIHMNSPSLMQIPSQYRHPDILFLSASIFQRFDCVPYHAFIPMGPQNYKTLSTRYSTVSA